MVELKPNFYLQMGGPGFSSALTVGQFQPTAQATHQLTAQITAQPSATQRNLSVAKPNNTKITVIIQNRTITFGSGQPFNSKWW
ncbi:MAG: hypothetical protein RL497_2658 [Pseudomonadota bacterium]